MSLVVDSDEWGIVGYDFGLFELGRVSGQVFADVDQDGFKTGGESGVTGWRIHLFDAAGQPVGWTETFESDLNGDGTVDAGSETGLFEFSGLTSGTYNVIAESRNGWTTGSAQAVTITGGSSGEVVGEIHLGTVPLRRISGRVFEDQNGDGRNSDSVTPESSTDAGLVGWTVFLDANANGVFDVGEPQTTTNETGQYAFDGVPAGNYLVTVVFSEGFVETTGNPRGLYTNDDSACPGTLPDDSQPGFSYWLFAPSEQFVCPSGPVEWRVVDGTDVKQLDYGFFKLVDIQGTVFEDLNNDGVRAETEPGLAGWTVFIDSNDDGVWNETEPLTISGPDGSYVLTDIGPGIHIIRQISPAGWTVTGPFGTESFVPGCAGSDPDEQPSNCGDPGGPEAFLMLEVASGGAYDGQDFYARWSSGGSSGSSGSTSASGSQASSSSAPRIFSVNDVTVNESGGGVAFTVSISSPPAPGEMVRVSYYTMDDTATMWDNPATPYDDRDYGGRAGTLSFGGTTSLNVYVPIYEDDRPEADERFFFELHTPIGGVLSTTQHTGVGTIVDNDGGPPPIAINDAIVTESDAGCVNARFTVTLSRTSIFEVRVNYATQNGSATAPADYQVKVWHVDLLAGADEQIR